MEHTRTTALRNMALAGLTLALAGFGVACGDDESAEDTTTSSGQGAEADAVDPQAGIVDEAEGSFELTTSDGSLAVAGTADECSISEDRQAIEVVFTGSALDVEVNADSDGGTVTIVGQFEGAVETLSIDETGEVAISGTGGVADDSAAPTTFEVNGNCP